MFKVTKPEYSNKTFRMPNDLISDRKRGVAVEREHGRLQIPLCQRRAYDTDMP